MCSLLQSLQLKDFEQVIFTSICYIMTHILNFVCCIPQSEYEFISCGLYLVVLLHLCEQRFSDVLGAVNDAGVSLPRLSYITSFSYLLVHVQVQYSTLARVMRQQLHTM